MHACGEHSPHFSPPMFAQRPHILEHHLPGRPPQKVERQILEISPPVAPLFRDGPTAREDVARPEPSLHRIRGQDNFCESDPFRRRPGLGLIGPRGQLQEGHNHLTRGHFGHSQSVRPLPRHPVQTWVLDHAFVVLDRDDLFHQIRWLGLGLRLGPGVHEEPVHLLNNPAGKKVVPPSGPPFVGRVLLYSFGSSPRVQVRLKPPLNPILPNPIRQFFRFARVFACFTALERTGLFHRSEASRPKQTFPLNPALNPKNSGFLFFACLLGFRMFLACRILECMCRARRQQKAQQQGNLGRQHSYRRHI